MMSTAKGPSGNAPLAGGSTATTIKAAPPPIVTSPIVTPPVSLPVVTGGASLTGKTITVSNDTQLAAAIKVAVGGETIVVNPGSYATLSLYLFKPATMVTFQSAIPGKATFTAVSLNTVTNITLDGFDIGRPLLATETINSGYTAAVGNSSNVNFRNLDIHGSINHNPIDDKAGMRVESSRDIQIDNTIFHDLSTALWVNKSSAVSVTNSTIYEVREGIDISGVNHMLVDHNLIYSVIPDYAIDKSINPLQGDHPDMIQVWTMNAGGSNDVSITNNALLLGKGMDTHGIFISSQDATRHSNFVIENNLVSTNNAHGISLAETDGAIINHNTVLTSGGAIYAASLNVDHATNVQMTNNISSYYAIAYSTGVTETNDVRLHFGGANDATNEIANFANPLKLLPTSVSDFAVTKGSIAANSGAGFDMAAYNSKVAFANYDTLTHALDGGAFLHHIA